MGVCVYTYLVVIVLWVLLKVDLIKTEMHTIELVLTTMNEWVYSNV